MRTTNSVVQVANTVTGEYDPQESLPFPYHIDTAGNVLRQDFWQGEPLRLVGFQRTKEQRVDLLEADWDGSDQQVAGMYPVFEDADGAFWNHKFPVVSQETGTP